MGIIKAVKTGNWNDPTVWDTGTLPGVSDDVYANGFVVTLTGNVNVTSLRNTSAENIISGGRFLMTTAYNVSAVVMSSTTSVLYLNSINGGNVTIIGSAYGGTTLGAYGIQSINCVNVSLTLNVNSYGGSGQQTGGVLLHGSGCSISFTGLLTSGIGIQSPGLSLTGSAWTGTVTGTASGGIGGSAALANTGPAFSLTASSSTITIYGNTNGGNGGNLGAIVNGIGSTLNIVGVSTGGGVTGAYGAYNNNANSTLRVFSAVGGAAEVGVGAVSLSAITTTEQMIFSQGSSPTNGNVRMLRSDNNLISLLDENSNPYIITPVSPALFPSPSNVRAGFVYNAGNLVGTLKVPSPENVRIAIETDNTVGTAALKPEDIVAAVKEALPRFVNAATVETVGDQLAALL